jgi:para-nitrobenzyl esterase
MTTDLRTACGAAAFVLLLAAGLCGQEVPVRIDSGLVSGATVGAKNDVRVYRGIPFAAPPVGELRWKAPQPVKPWEGVPACTEFGPCCPQPTPLIGQAPEKVSEDCLYLNVWTAAKQADAKLPVMVWIHGGGHTTGSGSMPFYSGETLAREGAVIVTINYRLGPFGYFAHPLLSKESPQGVSGNYGMLDQIAALEWVKRNIAAFGGDPARVTIFGESAGAVSVCRLMISPLAKGLFHRAVAESGGAVGRNRHLRETWYGMEPGEKLGERVAKTLGCDGEKDVLAALRRVSAEKLLEASDPGQGLFGKGIHWGPVVDGWCLPDDPVVLFESGLQHDVPLITGSNANEGTIFLKQLAIQGVMGYRLLVRAITRGHADEALKLFPCDKDGDVRAAIDRLVTVSAFAAPARFAARAMEKKPSKAWLYHFTRVPPTPQAVSLGAFHSVEIPYVFGATGPLLQGSEKDRELSRTMRSYWLRFAATGDPNGAGLPEWPAYDSKTERYMEFGDTVRVGSGLYKEECDLFDRLTSERLKARGAMKPDDRAPIN